VHRGIEARVRLSIALGVSADHLGVFTVAQAEQHVAAVGERHERGVAGQQFEAVFV